MYEMTWLLVLPPLLLLLGFSHTRRKSREIERQLYDESLLLLVTRSSHHTIVCVCVRVTGKQLSRCCHPPISCTSTTTCARAMCCVLWWRLPLLSASCCNLLFFFFFFFGCCCSSVLCFSSTPFFAMKSHLSVFDFASLIVVTHVREHFTV